MAESIDVSGMVLSAMPVGENDKRLVLLTREEGKITAFARGARRPKSTLLAASNPFVFGTFSVIPGRNAYSLIRADVMNYFEDLPRQMPGVYYGFYFLEMAGYYGREGVDEKDTLNLLYLSMKALQNPDADDRLVRRVFEVRLMTINGDYDPGRSGLSREALYVCRYIMQAPMGRIFSFSLNEEILTEVEKHLDRYMSNILDRRIRSLEILEQFKSRERDLN
ncbi:MAG TPA: DNA repair protein RecO [Lachnospiraceae bacterium]|nr:DNA repair protein RecO [Lachnospiraceae bacterium]